MTSQRAQDLLRQEIDDLSESIAQEVLDFVLFVKARRAEEAFLWEQVESAQRHRQAHPDEVQTVDAATWDQLTAHLDDGE
ncbi:hypothetical protein K2Z83_07420 [Oscillochloris sp. ZM17-4]|uniref:hypothetical protein n=1 Tax=Oscillochloris sp. ZM17-4 TaxID=2866714 RepID=UPI001C72BACA|nr:hypothetical protein [Oscillochloris sp. ZM17-4]MBX0327507.1 hypothetical protein [Oscillochloris sp. ZM17-4]